MRKGILLPLLVLLPPLSAWAQQGVPRKYDEIFRKYSKLYFGIGFDWKVFEAQAIAESNLNPEAKSWVGAKGIMQIMPTTYQEIQSKNPEIGHISDPRWSIAAGILYDRMLWDYWTENESIQDRLSFVLSSYNAGRRTIVKAKGTAEEEGLDSKIWSNVETVAPKVPKWRHQETLDYLRRIQAFYANLSNSRGLGSPLSGLEQITPEAKK